MPGAAPDKPLPRRIANACSLTAWSCLIAVGGPEESNSLSPRWLYSHRLFLVYRAVRDHGERESPWDFLNNGWVLEFDI